MKVICTILAGLLLQAVIADAEPTAPPVAVRLDVKNVGSAKIIDRKWESDYGSYWRDFVRTTRLEAEVGTLSKPVKGASIGWFFVGKKLSGTERFFVMADAKVINIEPGPAVKMLLESGGVESSVTNYAALGQRYNSGAKLEGWIVRVQDESSRTLAIRASSATLEQLARNQREMERLFVQYTKDTKK